MNRSAQITCAVAVSLLLLTSSLPSSSAQTDSTWSVPQDHFDGVNEFGFVSYWEQIGTLDLGGDLKIPLIIGFESSREWASPYLGQGWILGLLDSQFIATDEYTFTLLQPDGWTRTFEREKPLDTVLTGQGGWKAEIKGEYVTVWATSGWRLTFQQGKITSITSPKNRTLAMVYENGGHISTILERTQPVLRVEKNIATGLISAISFNDIRIGIEQGQKPRVQAINGKNTIVGSDKSLHKLILPNDTGRTYDFSTNNKLEPTLKISGLINQTTSSGERLITWNPATKFILQDTDWAYDVQPGLTKLANAAISRRNSQGQRELWNLNTTQGQEITLTLDGKQTVRRWFTSGILAGKIRKLEETKLGKTETLYQATYDETGQLIRELLKDGLLNKYEYNADGKKVSQYQVDENRLRYTAVYDKANHLVSVTGADGRTIQYAHDELGRETKMVIDEKLHSVKSYAPDGSWRKTEVYEKDGTTLARTCLQQFGSDGRLTVEKFTDNAGIFPEVTKNYFYDEGGKLEKIVDSQVGTYVYVTMPDGQRVGQLVEKTEK